MRILHVTHQYPPAIGGAERYIADLSEEFAARGHQVDVFTSQSSDSGTWRSVFPGYEHRVGVNVYRFRSLERQNIVWSILHRALRHYWPQRHWWYEPFIFFGGGPHCPRMIWQLLLHARQYDIVHLNCLVYAHAVYGYLAAKLWGIPVVITPHVHVEQPVSYDVGYERTVLAGCNHIFVDTPDEQLFLAKQLSPAKHISLGGIGIYPGQYPPGNPCDTRRKLNLPEDSFVLLFLGRKDKYKGLEIALQAFMQLLPTNPTLHFLAIGPETDDSRAMWPKYEDETHIHNLGSVTDAQKILALQACDCLILPSIGEAFGIVFLESWIMGKPVIGAATLAGKAVINDKVDGLVARPEDPTDFARCISYMLNNPSHRVEMGKQGRSKVLNNYTIPRITDRIENIYKQLTQNHHTQRQ